MSYSSINDAFNINSNFSNKGLSEPHNNFDKQNFIRGHSLNSFNLLDNTQENYCKPNNLNSAVPFIDSMFTNDNLSWESLNGTELLTNVGVGSEIYKNNNSKSNSIINSNTNSIINSNTSSNLMKKLTHRECIDIFNNPESYKDYLLTQALRHVSKCKLCKDEIKKLSIEQENNLKSTINKHQDKSFLNNKNTNFIPNGLETNKNQFQKEILIRNKNKSNDIELLDTKIESELKLLNDRINGETNLKYQNAMIQNNLSKYLEDLEEKKKINYKLDKIIELMNINLTLSNKLNNNYSMYNEYQNIPNLSKLSHYGTPNLINPSNTSGILEPNILYIILCIFILLLFIDIILRFNTKS